MNGNRGRRGENENRVRGIALFALLWGLFHATGAFAFHLGDHRAVTRIAVDQVRRCLPAAANDVLLSPRDEDVLVDGDIMEDLNLVRKWLWHSHYYNPFKKIEMRRRDSSVSVSEAEKALAGASREDSDELMGRAIHYIQDAAVPAHVEPVRHGLSDGFESLKVRLDAGFTLDCDELIADRVESLVALLRLTAIATDSRLDEKIPVYHGKVLEEMSWREAFWTPSSGPSFGHYGKFGNHFGDAELPGGYRVDPAIFTRFKKRQLALAVQSTAAALVWQRFRRMGAASMPASFIVR